MRQDEAKARETAEEIKDLQKKQNQDVDIEKIGYAHYSKKKIFMESFKQEFPTSFLVIVASGIAGGLLGTAFKLLTYETGIQQCETIETDTNFDLASYISQPWYPQFMKEQYYQKLGEYRCTSATYKVKEKETWGGYTIDVQNVNEDSNTTGLLCAKQLQPRDHRGRGEITER